MQPILYILIGLAGGLLGSMVGLGGGVFIVPVLTLFVGVPIKQAAAASAVAVIATSTAGALRYLRDNLPNVRLAMLLELATTVGAVSGALTAVLLAPTVLSGIFAVILVVMAVYIYLKRYQKNTCNLTDDPGLLGGRFYDPYLRQELCYKVGRLPVGLLASLVAGNLSGLLGIGGGVVQVPAMTVAMGVPLKVAVATSNLMIGVTACVNVSIQYARGMVNPLLAVPMVLGVVVGAQLGSRLAPKVNSIKLTLVLVVVLVIFAVQMGLSVFGIRVR